jgi:exodeoxyribonuclease-3
MKLISWNINGLRSAESSFLELIRSEKPDIILLQEIKADLSQLSANLINLDGYHAFFNSARKKGYAGVAAYSRIKPLKTEDRIGIDRFDGEGRFLKLFFPHFSLINVYMPHGGRGKENMDYKLAAYSHLVRFLKSGSGKNMILVGDFNIAHKEVDLARPRQNYENTMFTKEERTKIDNLLELGLIDSFRLFFQGNGYYSWYPYSFKARERNLGWRIDYAFVSEHLKPNTKNSIILKDVTGSDHCPILLEVDLYYPC